MNFVYDPKIAAQIAAYVNYVTAGQGRARRSSRRPTPRLANNPLIFPSEEMLAKVHQFDSDGAQQPDVHRAVAEGARRREDARSGVGFLHRHQGLTPYLLLLPGLVWLALFFVVPLGFLGYQSLQTGHVRRRATRSTGRSRTTGTRSRLPRAVRPLVRLRGHRDASSRCSIAYPLVYWIAFRAGRWKNVFLILIVAPFFVTYLVRTLAWLNILADEGPVVGFLRDIHVLGADGRLLATSRRRRRGHHLQLPALHGAAAVRVARADRPAAARGGGGPLREQAAGVPPGDAAALGARASSRARCSPSSRPRATSSTPQLLGTPRQYMIGNVIQSKFLDAARLPGRGGAVVHPDGADPGRAARLRARRRHGEADRASDGAGSARHICCRRSTRFLAFCYLLLPIAVVILFSFNAPSGRFNYVWEGFTLDNWVHWDVRPGIQSTPSSSRSRSASSRRSSRPCSARCSRSRSCATLPRPRRDEHARSSCRCRRPRSCSAPRS